MILRAFKQGELFAESTMLITAHIDESGTHAQSPITVMAGYVATADQWAGLDKDWSALVRQSGVTHIHAVDLFKRTKQFRGWRAQDVNALAMALNEVIAAHLQVGFAVIVRDDDYLSVYRAGPNPKRSRRDSKYGVCFRACLAFVPSYLATEFRLAQQEELATRSRINFVLERGHHNFGDAERLFALYKADAMDEWRDFVGTFSPSTKENTGAQAADFFAYTVYRQELRAHSLTPSKIEESALVADTALIDNSYPREPVPEVGPIMFRLPITRDILQSLKDDQRGGAPAAHISSLD